MCSSIAWTDKDRFGFENKGAAVFRATFSQAAPNGCLLDPTKTLQDSGLQSGDSIAVAQQPKVAVDRAMALWCVGGDMIVTWGDPEFGGDSNTLKES